MELSLCLAISLSQSTNIKHLRKQVRFPISFRRLRAVRLPLVITSLSRKSLDCLVAATCLILDELAATIYGTTKLIIYQSKHAIS